MKTPQFPTGDPAQDREIMRRIYTRERHRRDARRNNAIIVAVCAALLGIAAGIADLIL